MKKILTITFLFLFALTFSPTLQAQEELKWPGIDKSVMDMAYYPSRVAGRYFAKTDEAKNAKPVIRVIYSRPLKNDRDIFADVVKPGEVWRAGANESTEIMFYTDVKVGETKLKKGRYNLFVVPQDGEWEVHFSNYLDYWGHYGYDPSENAVAKIKVATKKTSQTIEAFTIMFTDSDNGANMLMGWDDTMVSVPINF